MARVHPDQMAFPFLVPRMPWEARIVAAYMTQDGADLQEVRQLYLRGLGHHSPDVVAFNVAWDAGVEVTPALLDAVQAYLPAGTVAP